MNPIPEEQAELRFVQSCATSWLRQRGFALVLENEWQEDGWRGEFLGRVAEEEVVLLCHKPLRGPYLTICLVVTTPDVGDVDGVLRLMDCAGDFDVAAWFPEEDRGRMRICSRLLLSGMNPADFDFTLNNLFCCRESLLEGPGGEKRS